MRSRSVRSWLRFRISTMLLIVLVMATVSDLYLRPKSPEFPFGTSMVYESRMIRSTMSGNLLCHHGPWHLRTRSGRPLIDGFHDVNFATGTWRFYDEQGKVMAEGPVQGDQFVGRWTEFTNDGSRVEIDFPPVRTAGTMTPPSTSESQPVKAASAADRLRWQKLLASDRFQDRSIALNEMAVCGSSALPELLEVVEDFSHPSRTPALHLIKRFGKSDPMAIERLSRTIETAQSLSNSEAIRAILLTQVVIDEPRRSEWLVHLLESMSLTDTMDSWDLYLMLDSSDGFYLGDLTSGTHDLRPSIRRLTASLLVTGLEQYTVCCDPILSQSSGITLLGTLPSCRVATWHGSTVDDVESTRRCHVIVTLLERMQGDTDLTIRSLVTHYLKRWKEESLVP